MMDFPRWTDRLAHLHLGELHLFHEVGSTNLEAEKLIERGVEPFSLVVADSQTAGKGRRDRTWITKQGQALAFSWILFPEKGRIQPETLGRISGLGALAVAEVVEDKLGLRCEIKWPNDVLIEGKKVAGILVENHWQSCQLLDVILGIGINVGLDSIPADPPFIFPATSLEKAAGKEVDRLEILVAVMESLFKWHRRLVEPSIIKAWNENLAYQGQLVSLVSPKGPLTEGKVVEVAEDGSLVVETSPGAVRHFHSEEIQLRLVDRS